MGEKEKRRRKKKIQVWNIYFVWNISFGIETTEPMYGFFGYETIITLLYLCSG